jgi:hypothetical protein
VKVQYSNILYIGIAARKSGKRSGKDTFADAFKEEVDSILDGDMPDVIKMSLADPLKTAAKAIFGLSDEQLYGSQAQKESLTSWDWIENNKYGKAGKMTARDILQYFGTEVMREGFDHNIWINSLKMNAEVYRQTIESDKLIVLVPDIRYPNESDFLDYLVDIYRKDADLANTDSHISEKAGMLIPDTRVNLSIENNSTIEDLQQKAKEYAHFIVKKTDV